MLPLDTPKKRRGWPQAAKSWAKLASSHRGCETIATLNPRAASTRPMSGTPKVGWSTYASPFTSTTSSSSHPRARASASVVGRNASAPDRAPERFPPIWTSEGIAEGVTPGWMCVNPVARRGRFLREPRGSLLCWTATGSAYTHVRCPSRVAARATVALARLARRLFQAGPVGRRLVGGAARSDPRARAAAAGAHRRTARGGLGDGASGDRATGRTGLDRPRARRRLRAGDRSGGGSLDRAGRRTGRVAGSEGTFSLGGARGTDRRLGRDRPRRGAVVSPGRRAGHPGMAGRAGGRSERARRRRGDDAAPAGRGRRGGQLPAVRGGGRERRAPRRAGLLAASTRRSRSRAAADHGSDAPAHDRRRVGGDAQSSRPPRPARAGGRGRAADGVGRARARDDRRGRRAPRRDP